MKSDKFINVKKGQTETSIPLHALQRYLDKGWVEVKEAPKEQDKTYDDYTVAQLKDIASNRGLYTNSRMRKSEIIDIIIDNDNLKSTKPSNKGFTDNLIK